MTRARDVSRLITTPPSIYATDSEASAGYLTLSSASSIYQGSPFRNIIINGAMQISQRGTSSSSITTSGYYTADRYRVAITTQGTWTQSVENDAPTGSGFRKSLKMLCTTADASPAAGDEIDIMQNIEGLNIQHIKKGTASAEQLTLSFWVKSNVTGTYIVNAADIDNSREVSKSYTILSSGTWEKKTITFPADTTGSFDNDSNNSLSLSFSLGAGSNFTSGTLQQTWGSTTAANRFVGQTNVASAINNYWQITGIQLEIGSTATPFEFKPIDEDLKQCQRYYEILHAGMVIAPGGGSPNTTRWGLMANFKIEKRGTPVMTRTTPRVYTTSGWQTASNPGTFQVNVNGAQVTDQHSSAFIHLGTDGGAIGEYQTWYANAEI